MKHTHQAAHYRIVVEGMVDPVWHECLGGLEVSEQQQPGQPVVTLLEGKLVDQSALQGVIDTLFMLDLRLMYVECLPQRLFDLGYSSKPKHTDAENHNEP